MSEHTENTIEKLAVVPLVSDTTHPDIADDDGPDSAAGAVVVLDGPPVDGGVPTYDAGTQKHTSQLPGASAAAVWMPLTTVVGGEPRLVWDANNSLIPTLVPI